MGTRRLHRDRAVEIEPIVAWWRRRYPVHRRSDCICTDGGWCRSVESLARRVQVSHSTMYRRLRLGFIDVYEADDWAVAVGTEARHLWPDWDRVDCAEAQRDVLPLEGQLLEVLEA